MSDITQSFSCKTEMDVREVIIRPLLGRLGYPTEKIITQLPLKYARLFLGRKKGAEKDRPLLGEADYIMDVDGRLRWVVEAKRPGIITDDDREQAYSYAMHPEVRAVVFAVISGTHFEIYHTFEKPEAGPILAFEYHELNNYFQHFYNIVSPEGLRRSHGELMIDTGQPLSPNLRSFAKVQSGTLTYTECPQNGENIVGLVVHLNEGSITRNETGGITALIKPSFHHQALTNFSNSIDAEFIELITLDTFISNRPESPSVFSQSRNFVIKEGTEVPFLLSPTQRIVAPVSMRMQMHVKVFGHLEHTRFMGKLVANVSMGGFALPMQIRGDVRLFLQ